jgi:hypothetical protein
MLGIIVFVVLLSGPQAKWVKRFLPNTANRIVFTVPIVICIVAWLGFGINDIIVGNRGEGIFSLALSLIVGAAFYRFANEWWLKKKALESLTPGDEVKSNAETV